MRPNASLISKLLRLAIVEILPEIKRDWSKRGCYDQFCEQLGLHFSRKISCFRSLGTEKLKIFELTPHEACALQLSYNRFLIGGR